jgi:2-polyprenyl-3-methyl-5-hydroxy-6-metoxy-1,4-benzoquinol methylase
MDPAYGKAYAQLYRTHWWWRSREIVVLREIERALAESHEDPLPFRQPRRPRILDVGCGDALFFDRLLEFTDVEGIESDASLISDDNPHRKRIHIGPLDDSFQPAEPFDVVLMLDVLEHIEDPAPVLRRAMKVLKHAGHVIITVPAFESLWTNHDDLNRHFVRYTKESFRALADEVGMAVAHERYLFHWTVLPKLATRAAEKVLKPPPKLPKTPPRRINGLLAALSVGEAVLLENVRVPFGSSLLIVGKRHGDFEAQVSEGEDSELDISTE